MSQNAARAAREIDALLFAPNRRWSVIVRLGQPLNQSVDLDESRAVVAPFQRQLRGMVNQRLSRHEQHVHNLDRLHYQR